MYIDKAITIQKYLIYLLPLSLLTGPALPDIFMSVAGLLFLVTIILQKQFHYFTNKLTIIFLFFWIYLLINSIFSDYAIFSLRSSLFYFRFGLLVLCISYLLNTQKGFIDQFTLFLVSSFLIGIVSGYYQYFFSETIFGAKSIYENRLLLLTSDQLLLGQFLSRLFPLLLALVLYRHERGNFFYFLIFIIFILTDVLIYLSGERTAFALLLVSTFLFLLFIKKFKIFRLFSIIFSMLIIVWVSIINVDIKERNVDETISQLGINSGERLYIFSPTHESHIFSSYKMFIDNPIIGIGPNLFRKFCNDEKYNYNELSCSTHPHNTYVQVLSEIGIVGFLFVLFSLMSVGYLFTKHLYILISKKNYYLSDYKICLLACLVCSLWPFFPTLNFFNNWINVVYFLPVGFLIYKRFDIKK